MTRADRNFIAVLAAVATVYVGLLLAMVLANLTLIASDWSSAWSTLARPEIQQAILLSLGTSLLSAVLSVWIGTGIAYLVSRQPFYGRRLIDFLMDLPIFLPPLVIGISLLILFRRTPLSMLDSVIGIAFYVPAIVLAQTVVGVAFVYRTMKATFDTISHRQESIAQSLGCSRFGAFCKITLPQAQQGLVTAAAIAWARSFGEFGPVLVFAGSIRGRTEVMPVSIYLELNSGNLSGAVVISLVMIGVAAVVLLVARVAADGWRGGAS
jgi:molybdate transport system permease protein